MVTHSANAAQSGNQDGPLPDVTGLEIVQEGAKGSLPLRRFLPGRQMTQATRDALADAETLRLALPDRGPRYVPPNLRSLVYKSQHFFLFLPELVRVTRKVAHAAFRACPELRG